MLNRFSICLGFLLLALPGLTQQQKIDSLLLVLKAIPEQSDTGQLHHRAQLLWSISTNYFRPLKAYEKSRLYARESLRLNVKLQNPRGVAQSLGNIAFAYLYENRSPEATDTFLLSYRAYEQVRDTAKMTYIISTLASHLFEMPEQSANALHYARLCVDLTTRANRPHGLCACSHLLGDLYDRMGKPDSAAFYVQNALNILKNNANIPGIVPLYLTMARMEERKRNHPRERDWLLKAVETLKKYPETATVETSLNCLLAMSRCLIQLGELDAAAQYLRQAAEFITQVQDPAYHERYYADLSQIAELQNRTADALRYFKLHINARDSVNNLENTRRITEIQLNHDFQQKQALVKAEQGRELALRDARNQQQRLQFILVLLGLFGAVGLYFYNYRQRQERRRTELELANLRAQINPHFIFNCLNSIYRYTKERDTDTAAKYLQKFSSLLRLVLENSRTERITLARDLEALQLYVDIEALRFKEKLQFSLEIDPEIDTSFLLIPGMLIQPHVENAIWHGLMHRKEGGKIKVQISLIAENLLRVTIEDDGIGRPAAAELESKSALTQKSLGQKITAERLKASGKLAHSETIDLTDENGNASGTKVVLEIPL
jgi:two-component sensor histidine kinase